MSRGSCGRGIRNELPLFVCHSNGELSPCESELPLREALTDGEHLGSLNSAGSIMPTTVLDSDHCQGHRVQAFLCPAKVSTPENVLVGRSLAGALDFLTFMRIREDFKLGRNHHDTLEFSLKLGYLRMGLAALSSIAKKSRPGDILLTGSSVRSCFVHRVYWKGFSETEQ